MRIKAKLYVVRWNGQTRKFVVLKSTPASRDEACYTRVTAIEKAKVLNAQERKIEQKLKKTPVSLSEVAL